MQKDSDEDKTGYPNRQRLDLRLMRCIRVAHKKKAQPRRKQLESHHAAREAVIHSCKAFILTYLPTRLHTPRPMFCPTFHDPHADLGIVKNASCPAHNLPDDMLYEIFVRVIADADAEPHNQHATINLPNITPIQVTLAGICRRWRATITGMSSLWSSITLDCAALRTTERLPRERLKLYLSSGGRQPISLSLTSSDRGGLYLPPVLERLYGELLDLINLYYRRWQDITLMMDHRLAARFSNINPTHATTIRSLAVDFRTQYFFDEDPYHIPTQLLSSFTRFPNLKHLDWRICSPWSYIPSPAEYRFWEKLTSVSINVSYGLPHLVALTLLQHLISASSISLNVYVHRLRADGLTREVLDAANRLRAGLPELITLPALRALNLTVDHEVEVVHDRVLAIIAAPDLECLALSLDSATAEDAAQVLREVKRMVAGAPKLKKMYLRLWRSRSFPPEDVAQLITMCLERKMVSQFVLVGDVYDLLPGIFRWIEEHNERDRLRQLVSLVALRDMSKFDIFDVYE